MVDNFTKIGFLYLVLVLMVLVPTDFMRLALNSFHDDDVIVCLEIENDLDTEEEESKEKSKDKTKIKEDLLSAYYSGKGTDFKPYGLLFAHAIRPLVLTMEIQTPPPELV